MSTSSAFRLRTALAVICLVAPPCLAVFAADDLLPRSGEMLGLSAAIWAALATGLMLWAARPLQQAERTAQAETHQARRLLRQQQEALAQTCTALRALAQGEWTAPPRSAPHAQMAVDDETQDLHHALQALQQHLGDLTEALHTLLDKTQTDGIDPLAALAQMPPPWHAHPLLLKMVHAMQDSDTRLRASMQAMTRVVERNSTTLADLSWQAQNIRQAMHMLAVSGAQAVSSAHLLAQGSDQVNTHIVEVNDLTHQARENSAQGQHELQQTMTTMHAMRAHTQKANTSLGRLQDNSHKIEHIAQLIREIADKINLLSLNAAIEAARAGEHGLGFAVVAQEVRNLAEKTFQATQEIDASVSSILGETEHTVTSIHDLIADVQTNAAQIEQVGGRLNGILGFASVLSQRVDGIVHAAHESTGQAQGISAYLSDMQQELERFGERIAAQEQQIVGLTELGEGFFDQLLDLRVPTPSSRMYQVARAAANAVQSVFEQALAEGRIRREDLMSTDYTPIPGTQPQKYRSRFDAFTDQVLPAIQEQVLREQPQLVFAICTDRNGYVPTHNDKFAKPPTGNAAVDLVQSRSKRLFNDRTGSRCGAHTKKMLQQTYKRDTGEIMYDLSVPIHVNGVHWGGFRMGYLAE